MVVVAQSKAVGRANLRMRKVALFLSNWIQIHVKHLSEFKWSSIMRSYAMIFRYYTLHT